MIYLKLFLVFFCLLINSHAANSLVGVEGGNTLNLPTNTKASKNKTNDNSDKIIKTGPKPINIPDFPQDENEDYKMLFDDGFSNVVKNDFQTGEKWDIFVNQAFGNEINNNYIDDNDDDFTQMEALEAEKKTIIDHDLIDKDNITTHRTRIMAYLTLDQILYNDLFGTPDFGYYVDAVAK